MNYNREVSLVAGESLAVSWSVTYIAPVICQPGDIKLCTEGHSIVVTAIDQPAHLKVACPAFAKITLGDGDDERRESQR